MPRRNIGRHGPHPVDSHVGGRLRMKRILLGMSQQMLADALGLRFQQVQKYERGANRVGASRLYEISQIFGVPISFFFEDMSQETSTGRSADGTAPIAGVEFDRDPLAKRETLELVRAYYRISDPRVRKRLFELTKGIAGVFETEPGPMPKRKV